ncbi:MAG: phage virion morphogenesis protein [Ahrensia sp.]|nr:phage virion morphogenesis protein [Ahrensia sp.]
MAGAAIEVSIDDAEVRAAFRDMARAGRNTRPIMSAIGQGLVSSTERRFISQTSPDGEAWQALNPDYAAGKRSSRILTESGRLRSSVKFVASNDTTRVGTNAVHAAAHQFGVTITPKTGSHLIFKMGGRTVAAKSVTIPERPFLGISSEDEAMIAEIVFSFYSRLRRR